MIMMVTTHLSKVEELQSSYLEHHDHIKEAREYGPQL